MLVISHKIYMNHYRFGRKVAGLHKLHNLSVSTVHVSKN